MSLKDMISQLAMVFTFLQFLSGSLICYKFVKQGHTGSLSALTFICGVFSTGSWLIYSILLEDLPMTYTNLAGVLSQVIYLLVYMVFCVASGPRSILQKQLFMLLIVLSIILYYVILSGINRETVKFHIGLLCCVGSISFYASPLAGLNDVIKTKSTANLPFPLILNMFLVTLLWGVYGYLINELLVSIPNGVCCVLSFVQLLLFLIYPNSTEITTIVKG